MRWILTAALIVTACQEEPGPRPPGRGIGAPAGPRVHELTQDSDPGQVDDTLIAHIQDERWERAYELMSSAYRRGVSLERFQRAVSANEYLKTTTLIGCSHVQTFEGGVQHRECILRSEAGNAFTELFYARDPEGWRMTGMVIGGTPAFPSPEAAAARTPAPGFEPW